MNFLCTDKDVQPTSLFINLNMYGMLQRKINSIALASFLMFGFALLLSSFSNKMGGDSFAVYINKKLVIQQYVLKGEAVKSLQLDQANYNDEIEVSYSHCGRIGTGRIISLRDSQNKILKEWRFQDTPDTKTNMGCNVKDILSVQKLNGGSTLQLYYSSNELPDGRLLASIVTANAARTAP